MNLPPESKRRLEIVLQIVDDWWGGLVPSDASTEEEIVEAERLLGIRLPSAMYYWYSVASKLSDRLECFGTPDQVYSLQKLHFVTGELLIFAMENQGCWIACIKLSDLSLNDPPIYFYDDMAIEDGPVDYREFYFELYNSMTFSEFLLHEMIITVWRIGQFNAFGKIKEEIVQYIKSKYDIVYSNNQVGDLYFGINAIAYISKHEHSFEEWKIAISTKTKRGLNDIVEITSHLNHDMWRNVHRDQWWRHDLTPECGDLVLPYPENVFPDCHLNSPPPRSQVTHHIDKDGNKYRMY